MGGRVKPAAASKQTPTSSKLQLLFHLSSFALVLTVFLWHFGSTAQQLPAAKGFGWFYKYLTFCGFNFQLVSLFLCVLTHLFPQRKALRQVADDLACTSFGIANSITIMYWSILVITMKPVEPTSDQGGSRTVEHGLRDPSNSGAPLWINLTVHLGNAIIAWTDIIITRRMFRTRAFMLSFIFGFLYLCWSQYATSINKIYPYPFLNKMPQPQGYIFMGVIGMCILYIISRVGHRVANRHSSSPVEKPKSG